MYYRMTVAGLERDLPICPVNDKLYIADGRTITAYSLEDPLAPKPLINRSGPDKAMQGYNFIDIRDGILAGKKYPRFDIWRIEE